MYQLGEGHGRYLVRCDSDNCMDVFEEPLLPKVGATYHGKEVKELRAYRLTEHIYLIEVELMETTITMANAGEPVPCP